MKLNAVYDYLAGEYGGLRAVAKKYGLRNKKQLEDRRGHRSGSKLARTPEEEMRDKLVQQERRIKLLEVENVMLKKVRELEGRRDFN